MTDAILRFENIATSYKAKSTLKGINLSVEEGEILSVVGESGSGKSTLLNTILGIEKDLEVTDGSLFFNGQDLTQLKPAKRREFLGRQIAVIPQNPMSSFNPLRQLGKQFREVCKSHGMAYDEAEIDKIFQKFGLTNTKSILKSYPYNMSGGMIQRIAIALMLLLKPKILLCDEITSALDVVSQKMVLKEILKINKEFGVTVIFVTHDFGIAKSISDHIAFINAGELVEYGKPQDILSSQTTGFAKRFIDALYSLETITPSQDTYQDYLACRENLLEFDKVSKIYGTETTLDQVSFDLKKGEILGIVGESGSGKSTILKMISGLLPFEKGQISLGDVTIAKTRPQELGRHLQSIFQDPMSSFDPSLTIRESFAIVEANFADKKGVSPQLKESILKDVELSLDLLDKYPRELSGGQCQRFAIARALISRPRLLLCDEITSSLDVISQRKVIDILKGLKDSYQLTILFVSHDLSVVANLCDRIMVLKDGRLAEEDLTYPIISSPQSDYTKTLLESVYQI